MSTLRLTLLAYVNYAGTSLRLDFFFTNRPENEKKYECEILVTVVPLVADPRTPRDPRDPLLDPRDPLFDPRDPLFDPRDPLFDVTLKTLFFDPRDPRF